MLKINQNKLSNQKIDKRFFSVEVTPINSLEEAKAKGNFNHCYVNNISFNKITKAKRVYFVKVTERIHEGREAEFLAKFGKKPLTNTQNYFFGVMVHPDCQENTLPSGYRMGYIVAVAADETGVFLDGDGSRSFLRSSCVNGIRFLKFAKVANGWKTKIDWFFLAEDE